MSSVKPNLVISIVVPVGSTVTIVPFDSSTATFPIGVVDNTPIPSVNVTHSLSLYTSFMPSVIFEPDAIATYSNFQSAASSVALKARPYLNAYRSLLPFPPLTSCSSIDTSNEAFKFVVPVQARTSST